MHCINPSVCEAKQAIRAGAIVLAGDAVIDPGVYVVLQEDDGVSHGVTKIGAFARIRAGAILCSGVTIGQETVIGHHVIVRRSVSIGSRTVVSHGVCLERETSIGDDVRISALTHVTGGTRIEDDVQIGARVVTVNDKKMTWRDSPTLIAPTFRTGCRVGSGATILAGVSIGERAVVGAGSTVTKNVPPNVVVWGTPAYIRREI